MAARGRKEDGGKEDEGDHAVLERAADEHEGVTARGAGAGRDRQGNGDKGMTERGREEWWNRGMVECIGGIRSLRGADWGEVWEAWHEEGRPKTRFAVEQEPAEGTEGEMMIGCEGEKRRWGKGR